MSSDKLRQRNVDDPIAIEAKGICKSYEGQKVLEAVSFRINKGENVGIIGPNGAGKSTLLKILSDVLRPDSGKAVIHGTVSSILEIGMGLHPDLSGTENVFFAGQLMGRSKQQVRAKMQEIVAFSELEEHMHKPVKHYSSGMYLRLAFSIYMLLDSDILLLDEVLSVGDASFRRKSFDRMLSYKNTDKTVILVSHGITEIENFCDRVIYLDSTVRADSYNIRKVVLQYMQDHPTAPKSFDLKTTDHARSQPASGVGQISHPSFRVDRMWLSDAGNTPKEEFLSSDVVRIHIRYEQLSEDVELSFIWKLFDMNDTMLLVTSSLFDRSMENVTKGNVGVFEEVLDIPEYFLNTGKYYLSVICGVNRESEAVHHAVLSFVVEQEPWMRDQKWSSIPAPILHKFDWSRTRLNTDRPIDPTHDINT